MTEIVGIIVDIVGSRRADDRAAVQASVHAMFREVDEIVAPVRPLWSTAGDEFQAMYSTVAEACVVTTLVRLAAADSETDVRFGIGRGQSHVVSGVADEVSIYDGSAWWAARRAIDTVHRLAGRTGPARTWAVDNDDEPADTNAALLLRDEIIGAMKPREARIARAMIGGQSQAQIAEAEGITQSAVSQSARRSGAATLVTVQSLWMGGRA
ncbi:SatD family protein [Microbacterium sp. ZW T5_56]|uniref:SatD family protein n=1 Tax=Microbacterium sp. ZW T5_56 TaxID=3378081 RepID=UPI00385210FF